MGDSSYVVTVLSPAWGYPDGKPDEYPPFATRYFVEASSKDEAVARFKERKPLKPNQHILFVEEVERLVCLVPLKEETNSPKGKP